MTDLVPQNSTSSASLGFVDLDRASKEPTPTLRNTVTAIGLLNLDCRHNVFHDRYTIEGSAFGNSAIQVSDPAARKLRLLIRDRFKFDPGSANAMDALYATCEANSYHPGLDYLDRLKHDGKPRIGRWLTTYMGAEDTEFNRGVGRLILIAAVRRMREPGTKFDCVMVLEGP
jgi:hypothetical protein